jgi:glucokinase
MGQFLLIGFLSIIALVLIFCLFKYFKNPANEVTIDSNARYPVLIADIGGTNVRLSLLSMSKDKKVPPIEIETTKLSPSKFPSLQELLKEYLSKVKPENYPLYAVFGIPGPVKNNEVMSITNIPKWPKFSGEELATQFKMKQFVLLNDFTCNGYGVQTDLKLNEDYVPLNDVTPQENGPKLIVGPGTGLGMGYLVKEEFNQFYTIGASEGGHQDYTAKTQDNFALREYFKKTLGNEELSIERVLSGQGLIIIYKYLKSQGSNAKRDPELEAKIDKFNDSPASPAANEINIELVNKGLSGKCELSKNVLEYFIGVFGDVAGDVSLFSLPTGGLYLVGGLSVALEPIITGTKIFMDHYINKDNFAFLLKTFPVYLVKNGNIGMLGAAECARRLLLKEK